MSGILRVTSGVVVFSPDQAAEATARAAEFGSPLIAFMPIVTPFEGWFVADGAYDYVGLRADAYASDRVTLASALDFVKNERRAQRSDGALRLTYLGSLGEEKPPDGPPIGGSIPLEDTVMVGRQPSCAICLRQGAHSDENTVARLHCRIERTTHGAKVTDLKSTNGTWLRGKRIEVALAEPGDEIAVACTHRLRVDGAP